MKIKTLIFALLFTVVFLINAYPAGTLEISGVQIPLIEGAVLRDGKESQAANLKVHTYTVDKPLSEVIKFYESFLKENGFLLIGGKEDDSFNASVKKGDSMFTLKIYSENQHTILQFIW